MCEDDLTLPTLLTPPLLLGVASTWGPRGERQSASVEKTFGVKARRALTLKPRTTAVGNRCDACSDVDDANQSAPEKDGWQDGASEGANLKTRPADGS